MRILISTTLIVLIVCLQIKFANSQNPVYRNYKTNEYMDLLRQEPNTRNKLAQLERDMNRTLRFEEQNDFVLPIVFHVLYKNNNQKVDKEKILEQLDILNAAFSGGEDNDFLPTIEEEDRRNLEKYGRLRENTRVQFCFPLNTPQNKDTDGVIYEKVSEDLYSDYYSMKENKDGVKPWNTEKYINVWIVNLPDTMSGFAQGPNGPKKYDGIVIDYEFIENIGSSSTEYNRGYTLVHLMGNYLGLLPIWGEYPCSDDHVSDTPIHNAPNYVCPEENHISTCAGNPTEMSNNYMDNTYDKCLEYFTTGQMQRMQMVLHIKGPRGKLGKTDVECGTNYETQARSFEVLKEDDISPELLVRPNPVTNFLYVSIEGFDDLQQDRYEVHIFDMSGRQVYSGRQHSKSTLRVNASNWQSGMYVLRALYGDKVFSQKIIVQ